MCRKGGHLEVLQWARYNGCPWDEWTCALAASSGHLEVLQWLRSNGCPWDEWTCARAEEGGHRGIAMGAISRIPLDLNYRIANAANSRVDMHLKGPESSRVVSVLE